MSEFLKSKTLAAGAVLLLGCAACSGQESNAADTKHGHSGYIIKGTNVRKRQVEYLRDGARLVLPYSLPYTDSEGYTDDYSFKAILQWCESGALEQQTQDSAASVVVEHFSGCADGRLTPSDFIHTPSESH